MPTKKLLAAAGVAVVLLLGVVTQQPVTQQHSVRHGPVAVTLADGQGSNNTPWTK